MNHSENLKQGLENLSEKTFYFCLGATSSIVENTQDNLQKLSKNAQKTVEELIKIGEDTCDNSPKINFPEVNFSEVDFPEINLPNFNNKDYVSKSLKTRLFVLVRGDKNLAERLIALQKQQNPGHPEKWYWEKVIYDLKRH
ncbi:MAG: hypothetical protein AB4057_04210 [Crocosphaera sp.]